MDNASDQALKRLAEFEEKEAKRRERRKLQMRRYRAKKKATEA